MQSWIDCKQSIKMLLLLMVSLFSWNALAQQRFIPPSPPPPLLSFWDETRPNTEEYIAAYIISMSDGRRYLLLKSGHMIRLADSPFPIENDIPTLDPTAANQEIKPIPEDGIELPNISIQHEVCPMTAVGNHTISDLAQCLADKNITISPSEIEELEQGTLHPPTAVSSNSAETFWNYLVNTYVPILLKVHGFRALSTALLPDKNSLLHEPAKIVLKGVSNGLKSAQAGKGLHIIRESTIKGIARYSTAFVITRLAIEPNTLFYAVPATLALNYYVEHVLNENNNEGQENPTIGGAMQQDSTLNSQAITFLAYATDAINRGAQIIVKKHLATKFSENYKGTLTSLLDKIPFPMSDYQRNILLNVIPGGYSCITLNRIISGTLSVADIMSDSFAEEPMYPTISDKAYKIGSDVLLQEISSYFLAAALPFFQLFVDSKRIVQGVLLLNLLSVAWIFIF